MTDAIVFVYGPCPASASEVVMVQRSGILEAIPRDSKMIADGGFRGFDAIAILYRWGEVRDSELTKISRVGFTNASITDAQAATDGA